MAQYDVYRQSNGLLICNLQSDLAHDLESVIAVPLFPMEMVIKKTKINPVVVIDELNYIMQVEQMTAVRRSGLGEYITNISKYHYDITNAVDFLFHGF